jgi:biopolymer transport protein TolQ
MNFIINTAAAATEEKVVTGNQLLHGIANAGIVVQALLLAMVALSVWNWFIILKKKKQFEEVNRGNEEFLSAFWNASNLQQINSQSDRFSDSPIARLFKSGYQEIERVIGAGQEGLMLSGMENLERSLRKTQDQEIATMENHLSVLATTGSTAPFIGLLGTVIGIMSSFQDIAQSGSASLAVVAPGISEALFATAVGLFAAIPAVVFYNYLINKIKKIENQLSGFNSDFLNIARRNFFKHS